MSRDENPVQRSAAPPREMRKQISFFVGLRRWKQLRDAAVAQQIPITTLCERLLQGALPPD